MSYSIELTFFHDIIGKKDILNYALTFCKNRLNEHMEEEIRDGIYWMPSFGKEDLAIWDITVGDKLFLKNLFNKTFIYWKKYKMLAVLGVYPDMGTISINHGRKDRVCKLSPVVFQNQSDKDADYSTWMPLLAPDSSRTELSDLYSSIDPAAKSNVPKMSDDEIKDFFRKNGWDEEDMDIEYLRKTYLCEKIEDLLEIQNYLYKHPSDNIIAFDLCDKNADGKIVDIMKEAVNCNNELMNKYKKTSDDKT